MNQTILLVEDNPDDVELTEEAFKETKRHYDLAVARDGAEAIEYLFSENREGNWQHPLPALVLLDLKLPRLDGHEVLQRIRSSERTQLLPVIILTSSRDEEDIVRSYRLCCNSYLRKPLDFEQFVETIQQMEKYWLFLNIPATRA
jgi:two-component system response regulator